MTRPIVEAVVGFRFDDSSAEHPTAGESAAEGPTEEIPTDFPGGPPVEEQG